MFRELHFTPMAVQEYYAHEFLSHEPGKDPGRRQKIVSDDQENDVRKIRILSINKTQAALVRAAFFLIGENEERKLTTLSKMSRSKTRSFE